LRDVMKVKTGIEGFDAIAPKLPIGGIIIVSGSPGTGKTSFAAGFIYNGAVKYGEPGVYASLIEDRDRFHEYMRGFGYDFEKLEERGLFRYIALPTLLQEGVSASISMVLDVVESIKARRLVIDSYTALSQMFKSQAEARTFLHTLISRIVKRLECTTILIKEEQTAEKKEYGFEEFVADAVIHLKTNRLEDKLVRELTIVKLRGSEVRLPDACFTLHGGFRVIRPLKIEEAKGRYEPPPDPPGCYTTGIPDLDREIGGYPEGSTILVEVDPKLTPREYSVVLYPTIASFILKGRNFMVVPSGGVSPAYLKDLLKRYGVGEKEFLKRCLIFYEKGVLAKALPNVVEIKPKPLEEAVREIIDLAEKRAEEAGKRGLIGVGVDRAIRLGGEEVIDYLAMVQDYVRVRHHLMIWFLKPTRPGVSEKLAPLADIHLKIARRHGGILLYGIKPRTPLYAVQQDPTGETPTPKIIPIT